MSIFAMTADDHAREIRAALSMALAHLENAITCDGVDLATEVLEGRLAELLDSAPPAPRVFFPGDTVPAKVRGIDRGGWFHGDLSQPWVLHHGVTGGAIVEIFEPTREEWQAVVDQARAEREES